MAKKKTDAKNRINEALLEMTQDFRGSVLSPEAADKITMRLLGKTRFPAATQAQLTADDIRALREHANMSQAVFARILNVTVGYVSQLERGAARPKGPALALLNLIKRKGIEAIL